MPKTCPPNYREYYEKRQFAMSTDAVVDAFELDGETVPFGTDLLFEASDVPGFVLGVEICEDFWEPVPPSTYAAMAGATVIANLSASNITIGKAAEREMYCVSQSARAARCGYIYSAAGYGGVRPTSPGTARPAVFELGAKIAESPRFADESALLVADIDVERIVQERARNATSGDCARKSSLLPAQRRRISFAAAPERDARPRWSGRWTAFPMCRTIRQSSIRTVSRPTTSRSRAWPQARSDRHARAVIGVSGGLDSYTGSFWWPSAPST